MQVEVTAGGNVKINKTLAVGVLGMFTDESYLRYGLGLYSNKAINRGVAVDMRLKPGALFKTLTQAG